MIIIIILTILHFLFQDDANVVLTERDLLIKIIFVLWGSLVACVIFIGLTMKVWIKTVAEIATRGTQAVDRNTDALEKIFKKLKDHIET